MQVWKTELFPGTAGCLQFPVHKRQGDVGQRLMWDTKKLAMVAHSYKRLLLPHRSPSFLAVGASLLANSLRDTQSIL